MYKCSNRSTNFFPILVTKMENSEESVISDEENSSLCEDRNKPNQEDSCSLIKKKKLKTGVVYLSFIPPYMSTDILRRMLSQYGPVGRIFIQIVQDPGGKTKKKLKEDTLYEGWVEFLKKRHAKSVASMLNNTKMGGKKKSRFYDCLWNIKYLSGFKWIHLMERLNYEKAVMRQKLRAEVSQAKRIANHFREAVERQEQTNRKRKHDSVTADTEIDESPLLLEDKFKQRESREEKRKRLAGEKRDSFLKSLFS